MLLSLVSASASAQGKQRLVVFPFDGAGITSDRLSIADAEAVAALNALPGVAAMGAAGVSERMGFDLAKQVAECANDVLCLVQIGEVAEATHLLVGQLKDDADGTSTLRISVLDVMKAAMVDTLRWTVPSKKGALSAAVRSACVRLFGEPDATIVLDVWPNDADVRFFGAPASEAAHGEPISYWSGVYYGRVTRNGYLPQDIRIEVPKGGPTSLRIELEQDPLWIGANTPRKPRADRGTVPVKAKVEDGEPSPLANYWAWGLSVAGAGGGAAGGVLMSGAQSSYDEASGEQRFAIGQTSPWDEAKQIRQDSRDEFDIGTKVVYGGAGLAAAGFIWMIVDAALRPSKKDKVSSFEMSGLTPVIGSDGAGVSLEVGWK